MNKNTNKVVFYIIIFFLTLTILLGLFFAYKIFFTPSNNSENDISFLDKDFNDIIKQKEIDAQKRKDQKDIEYADYKKPPCLIKDNVYEHGTIKSFFSRASVGVYESCKKFSQVKKCDNGIWLGESKFEFSTCERTVDCKLNEDTLIKNGKSIELYSKNSVPYGSDCERYKGIRICKETILTGSAAYKYKTCKVSNTGICKIPNNKGGENILADERSHTFYSSENVGYNESCSDVSQNRLCSKGILYGDPAYYSWTCNQNQASSCNIDEIEINHGSSQTMYSKRQAAFGKTCKFFAQIRACSDGNLDGQEEYAYASCRE